MIKWSLLLKNAFCSVTVLGIQMFFCFWRIFEILFDYCGKHFLKITI